VTQDTHSILAKEGSLHAALIVAIAVAVYLWAGFLWSLPIWLAVVFVIQFFRDPKRTIPTQSGIAVCPADGKVVYSGVSRDPYLDRDAVKMSIFMNVFSVHSNRIPVSGTVEQVWYIPGKFFNAELDKSSDNNERNAVWIKTDDGADVVCVQVAGLIARRILCYVGSGQNVQRGQRYGFIRFGSRVDVFLPEDFRTIARLGDWVHAGMDVLGHFSTQPGAMNLSAHDDRQTRS